MSICDWFKKKQTVSECVVRVLASSDLARTSFDDAFAPKPDTVESVLNQFIALGYDKPEVVIKGAVRHDGSERYEVTIDGEKVYRRGVCVWLEHFDSLAGAEEVIADRLKLMLGGANVEEIEITY